MDQRQELSPEMQIFLIASDVDEVKSMIEQLRGTVGEIHISLIGTKDKPGVYEELRLLSHHTHPEIETVRTELRILTVKISAGMTVGVFMIDVLLRFFWRL